MTELDWNAEGLLEGLEGAEREARIDLLEELHADGVELEELREAVRESRLVFLPVERALGEPPSYSARDIAELAGLEYEFLTEQWQALGLPISEPDVVAYGERDLEAAKRIRAFVDAGVPREGIVEMARVLGQTTARIAEASRFLMASSFVDPAADEYEIAQQARLARPLSDLMRETLAYVYGIQLVDQLRHEAANQTDLPPGQREVAVCFADIVGWTELSEDLEDDRIGSLADRLAAMTTDHLRPPVRLVKMIGDAAMLVSPDDGVLLDVALALVEAAELDDDFPQIRAGIASGRALSRWGDWYGRPVNLASRVCSRARPGSVLVTGPVRDACDENGYRFSAAGEKRLKGIGPTPLWRARRAASSTKDR